MKGKKGKTMSLIWFNASRILGLLGLFLSGGWTIHLVELDTDMASLYFFVSKAWLLVFLSLFTYKD